MLGVVGWWFITDVSRQLIRSHLQGPNRSWTAWALKIWLVKPSPNVATNHQPTLRRAMAFPVPRRNPEIGRSP